jgi:hypothetical protein
MEATCFFPEDKTLYIDSISLKLTSLEILSDYTLEEHF